ncbi:MAG: biopolymer transporter ExbD [Bacteroidaceae bacterium]|nr:biopolymer transporter ExbD [Bacteroidaceae bacterium]
MGRFHVKKQDTFIDMTPMSDVMVLLLTFFMLTATFTKEEPVQVNVPGSVSKIQIPEKNLLTIFISPQGKIFMNMDNPTAQRDMAQQLIDQKKLNLSSAQLQAFAEVPTFGTPLNTVGSWVDMEAAQRNRLLNNDSGAGIPCDSVNDELKEWVTAARNANGENMRIAIKADKETPYSTIKEVMNSLRRIDESRYNLITTLKGEE